MVQISIILPLMHTRVNHIDDLHRPLMLRNMLTLKFLEDVTNFLVAKIPANEGIVTDGLLHVHAFEGSLVMLVPWTWLLVSFGIVKSICNLLARSRKRSLVFA